MVALSMLLPTPQISSRPNSRVLDECEVQVQCEDKTNLCTNEGLGFALLVQELGPVTQPGGCGVYALTANVTHLASALDRRFHGGRGARRRHVVNRV